MSASQQALLMYSPLMTALDSSTLWLNAQDPSLLYVDSSGTGVSTDGDVVRVARDARGRPFCFTKAAGDVPTYKTAAVNGKSALRWAGGADRYFSVKATTAPGNGIPTGSALNLSDLLASGTKTVIYAFSLNNPVDATPYATFNDVIGGYFYATAIKSGAVITHYTHNYSGGDQVVSCTMSANEWCVVTVRHSGGTLANRKNAGSWSTASSGNSGSLSNEARLGCGYTYESMVADTAHFMTWNTALSDDACYEVEKYIGASVGLTL